MKNRKCFLEKDAKISKIHIQWIQFQRYDASNRLVDFEVFFQSILLSQ